MRCACRRDVLLEAQPPEDPSRASTGALQQRARGLLVSVKEAGRYLGWGGDENVSGKKGFIYIAYSTLDLTTTDIELSAIRIFLA